MPHDPSRNRKTHKIWNPWLPSKSQVTSRSKESTCSRSTCHVWYIWVQGSKRSSASEGAGSRSRRWRNSLLEATETGKELGPSNASRLSVYVCGLSSVLGSLWKSLSFGLWSVRTPYVVWPLSKLRTTCNTFSCKYWETTENHFKEQDQKTRTRNHNENMHLSCATIIVDLSYNETNRINRKCLKLAFNHINQ